MSHIIPNIFHFIFGLRKQTEPFHLVFYLCLESCLQVNHPDQIFFYYHHEPYGKYWDLIRDKLTLVKIEPELFVTSYQYRDKGIQQFDYAHQSDFIRLQKLIEFGGVYADIDTLFVNPIPPELFIKPFVLGREDDIICQTTKTRKQSLCNAFILSEKQSSFGRLWLEGMSDAFDGSWSNHSTIFPQQLSKQYPELIHIEPKQSFYRYSWTTNDINALFQGYDPDCSGLISIHLWSHLWWSKKRRDFTKFHSGLLTETFIRNTNTTYNILARKYLPEQPHPKKGLLNDLINLFSKN